MKSMNYKNLFFTNKTVLKNQFTKKLHRVLQIEEWFHPDLDNNELLSENETFILIAKIITKKDTNLYTLLKAPNIYYRARRYRRYVLKKLISLDIHS